MDYPLIKIDGIIWNIVSGTRGRRITPLCPVHKMRLNCYEIGYELTCADCEKSYRIPRRLEDERRYVLDKVEARDYKNMKVLNLDDEAVPMAEDKVSSKDNKYFVTAILTQSKAGKRLVVYAGEKGKKEKTQIFVEPDIKRLAFDQNDLHPSEVFTKLEATFSDNVKNTLEKAK